MEVSVHTNSFGNAAVVRVNFTPRVMIPIIYDDDRAIQVLYNQMKNEEIIL